jgi:hypothetical protein
MHDERFFESLEFPIRPFLAAYLKVADAALGIRAKRHPRHFKTHYSDAFPDNSWMSIHSMMSFSSSRSGVKIVFF